MRFLSTFLLGLAASTASAIDVYGYFNDGCGGSAAVCYNLNPSICCAFSAGSVQIRAVPSGWNIKFLGSGGGGCSSVKRSADTSGADVCHYYQGTTPYTGASYYFNSRKRAAAPECAGQAKPDALILADGVTEYNLVGLDDAKVQELFDLAAAGVGVEGIPAEFNARRK